MNDIKKFLMFDFMLTPWIIRVLYAILQFALIVISLLSMIFRDYYTLGFDFKSSLALLVGGTIVLRVFFEVLMVQFKVAENTSEIKDVLKKKE